MGFDRLVDVLLALKREVSEELHREHFMSGTVSLEDDLITVAVSLYEAKRAKLIEERTFAEAGTETTRDQGREADARGHLERFSLACPDTPTD